MGDRFTESSHQTVRRTQVIEHDETASDDWLVIHDQHPDGLPFCLHWPTLSEYTTKGRAHSMGRTRLPRSEGRGMQAQGPGAFQDGGRHAAPSAPDARSRPLRSISVRKVPGTAESPRR